MADQQAPPEATATIHPVIPDDERPDPDYQKCVRSSDGKIIPLVTYSFEDPCHLQETSKWLRLGKPPSRVPSTFHVMNWALSGTRKEGSTDRVLTPSSVSLAFVKLTVALPTVMFLMCSTEFGIMPIAAFFQKHKSDPKYEEVKCNKNAAHTGESSGLQTHNSAQSRQSYLDPIRLQSPLSLPEIAQPDSASLLRNDRSHGASTFLPARHLCLIRDFDTHQYETINVSDYINEHGDNVDLEFVFVSYTRMHFRVATDEEINRFTYPSEEIRTANKELAHRDRKILTDWGVDAAREAGEKAFWIDFECIRDTDGVARASSGSDDVYRIGDVVRIAHSMIIALGPLAYVKAEAIRSNTAYPDYQPQHKTLWLREWGSRLWTLPELLLCPGEHRIKVFVLGDSSKPKAMAKRNFVARAWDDAEEVNELVNHFEGSAVLTQFHLIEAALACFSKRKTDQFSGGDIAYSIMGLLPQKNRPKVNKTDSSFQAFAKLSLAGESSAFLERLICLYNPGSNTPWYDIKNYWGARLNGIYPTCHISEVLDSDAVILSGVHGATIQWSDFDHSVPIFEKEDTLLSYFTRDSGAVFWVYMYLSLLCWLFEMLAANFNAGEAVWPSWTRTLTHSALLLPIVFYFFYRQTKRKDQKPRLVGFEGFINTGTIEKHLYGSKSGEFTLAPNLGRYNDNQSDEDSSREDYPFTIVDIFSKTVTHLRAKSPPVALFTCAREGNMVRGLLCSYDWKMDTYHRQGVVRLSADAIERMYPVKRLWFSPVSSPNERGLNPTQRSDQDAIIEAGAIGTKARTWKVEFAFLCILMVATSVRMPIFLMDEVDERKLDWFKYYYIAFIAAQLPSMILIRYVSIHRIFPRIALLNGIMWIIYFVFPLSGHYNTHKITIFIGFPDGIIAYVFISYVWSWYSLKEIPLRLLIWPFVCRGRYYCKYFIYGRIGPQYSEILEIIIFGISSLYFGMIDSSIIGRPHEVPWLSGSDKLIYSHEASTFKFGPDTVVPAWRNRRLCYLKYVQCATIFSISVSSAFLGNGSSSFNKLEESILLLTAIFAGSFLYQFPEMIVETMAMLSMPSLPILIFWHGEVPMILASFLTAFVRITQLILPLIWIACIRLATTWTEALTALSFSLGGVGLGVYLRYIVADRFSIIFTLANMTVLGLFWGYDHLATIKSFVHELKRPDQSIRLNDDEDIVGQ